MWSISGRRLFITKQKEIREGVAIRVKRFHTYLDGDVWTSHCEEFDIDSCGDTKEKAETNLNNALLAHFRSLDNRDSLIEVLRKRNIMFKSVVQPAVMDIKSTQGATEIPWDKLWDDMPYKKTQVTLTTTRYKVVEIDSPSPKSTQHRIPLV